MSGQTPDAPQRRDRSAGWPWAGRAAPVLALAGLLLSACALQQPIFVAPGAGPAGGRADAAGPEMIGPAPPLVGPERLGGLGEVKELDGLADALACLADDQPVYAVMQGNTNVRNAPGESSCRLGRVAAGSLVRVEGIYRLGEATPLASLDRRTATNGGQAIGYAEDIQPLFERSCVACHSGAVRNAELQVTEYEALMAGSRSGPVVEPGAPAESLLWQQLASGAMPLVGKLGAADLDLVYRWIQAGAPGQRPDLPAAEQLWLHINPVDFTPAANDCEVAASPAQSFVSAGLARVASCAAPPEQEQLARFLPRVASNPEPSAGAPAESDATGDASPAQTGSTGGVAAAPAPVESARPAPQSFPAGRVGIQAGQLGLPPASDGDPWLVPQGGFCIEQRLQNKLEDQHGITSLAFAPDGRLFLGLDAPSSREVDPNILFDAFHPSRAIAVYNSVSDDSFNMILAESGRVTGMTWHGGALYLNRAGEVGRIPDGGGYERLASGFAVNGRLFHANNGIAIANGWLYVSAGGVRDGYSDGVIAPGDGEVPAETMAANIAGGGNRFAARLVRAPLGRLLAERTIGVFQTAARGLRNPYGLTADPAGRLWFTDNGATNVAGEYSAGDEVNLFDPRALPAAAAAGDEGATPFYGFPLTLAGMNKDWWTAPVLPLLNTAAPTGITWAYGTVFFAQYGRDPGLYRLANGGNRFVAERILLGWPIQAVTTAPDGAIWIGMGNGGLYRMTPGC